MRSRDTDLEKKQKPKIYLASPHMSSQGFELEYIQQAFDTNWIAPLGPNVNNFEKEFADYLRIPAAVALSSGTAAIHLALKLAGAGEGYKPGTPSHTEDDIVLCPSLTFSASANPIVYQRATPVFIDSETESWNMDPQALKIALEKYGSKVKAVILVHLYGLSAQVETIYKLCQKYDVPLIEDAAESLGSLYLLSDGDGKTWKHTGTKGDYGCFSFNGNKIITTSGGGMITVNREDGTKERINKVRFWSTQSRDPAPWYQHSELGFNYRMSNICAGIGLGQMQVLDEHIAKKKQIFEYYKAALKDYQDLCQMMPVQAWSRPNYWLSCCTFADSQKPMAVYRALKELNIESRPIWKPMHLQPYYSNCDFITVSDGASVSEVIFNHGLCLPSDINMTENDLERIRQVIKEII